MASSVSNSGFDISNRYMDVNGDDYSAYVNRREEEEKLKQLYEDKGTLSFEDMLSLMVAQFQNQTMDDQASTTDMMNQLVQMSTMNAMNQMTSQMEELTLANVMSYSASLMDKEVTVGVWEDEYILNDDGTISTVNKLVERVGTVTGVGTYNGQQVIFLDDGNMYYLSQIMAVGRLPKKEEPTEDEEPKLPEDPEVKIPDNLDPGFNQGEAPEVKEPDDLDPSYGAGDKEPEYNGENGAETEAVG